MVKQFLLFLILLSSSYCVKAQNVKDIKDRLRTFYVEYNSSYLCKNQKKMHHTQDSLVQKYCTKLFFREYIKNIRINGRGWDDFMGLVSSEDLDIIKKTLCICKIGNKRYKVSYQILDSDINHKPVKETVLILLDICIENDTYKIDRIVSFDVIKKSEY